MSFLYTPNLKDEKTESLQTQYDYLRLLRLRQLQWMSSAEDPSTKGIHLEVSGLIEGIIDRYRHLLEASQP